jgi:hypothetical protein
MIKESVNNNAFSTPNTFWRLRMTEYFDDCDKYKIHMRDRRSFNIDHMTMYQRRLFFRLYKNND